MILWVVFCFYCLHLLLQWCCSTNAKVNSLSLMSRSFLLVYELMHSFWIWWLTLFAKNLIYRILVLNNVLMDLLSVVPSIWWILRLMSSSMHCWYWLVEHRFFWTNGCRFLLYKKLNLVTLLQEWTYFVRFSVNMCIFVCA